MPKVILTSLSVAILLQLGQYATAAPSKNEISELAGSLGWVKKASLSKGCAALDRSFRSSSFPVKKSAPLKLISVIQYATNVSSEFSLPKYKDEIDSYSAKSSTFGATDEWDWGDGFSRFFESTLYPRDAYYVSYGYVHGQDYDGKNNLGICVITMYMR